MIKKILATGLLAAAAHAQAAGFADLLKGVADLQRTVQQGQAAIGANTTTPATVFGSNRTEPDWLPAYPRAQLRKEFVNPFDTVVMPLTQPALSATTTRYAVPMEGKVTMLQYSHEADDSPLLIQRHYDALLAQQGFERAMACSSPCPAQSASVYWMKMLDPNNKVVDGLFPAAPVVLIGYKANAIALIAIGKSYNAPYTTFVKLVEGNITNRADLDAWLATFKAVAPPAPKTPALTAPPATVAAPPTPSVTSEVVEAISPARLQNAVTQTRGRLFVMLSSKEAKCPFCVRANPVFAALANKHADTGRFVTATWEPWQKAFEHDFVKAKGIGGLPTYLAFTDGAYVGRVDGNVALTELEQKLIIDPQLPKP